MRKHLDRRAAQAAAVDDACVVELVGHHHIVFREKGGHRARIRGKSTLKDDDGLGPLEVREPPLQLHMYSHRSGDCSHRP